MKKELCLLTGILIVSFVARAETDQEVKNGYFSQTKLRILEQQFAELFRIQPYKTNVLDILDFKNILDNMGVTDELKSGVFNIRDKIICAACQTVIRNIQTNYTNIEIVGTVICNIYTSLSTWTVSDFCREVVRINKPVLEYVIKHSNILTPEYACSVLLQNEKCYYSHPALTWRIHATENGQNFSPNISRNTPSAPLKILHLSDFHISQDYEINGVSNCGYPVCCKRALGNPIRGQDSGKWGDYNCDIPPWLLTNTLKYISNTHKDIDLIYFTGDIIDHMMWKASKEDNSRDIAFTFHSLAEYFPNVVIIPALGNHESVPINVFPPPHITEEHLSQNWLYELNALHWDRWLPQETLSTVKRQGYFSVLANYKLRVIVLNNNVCYIYNWWLLYETNFLKEQIEFLKKELTEAEASGQYVHIIGHIFPGEKECIEPWEVSYNTLITRFAHIIKGQFFGHTHTDGLKVFYSKIDGRPNNVAFNGASLTPYVKYNPNYKIVSVDSNNFDIMDIETYYFNLTEANKYPDITPRWGKLYSMKDAYSLRDLSPESFDWLARRLSTDGYLLNQYWRYYVREGDASLRDGCNIDCQRNLVASITRVESLA